MRVCVCVCVCACVCSDFGSTAALRQSVKQEYERHIDGTACSTTHQVDEQENQRHQGGDLAHGVGGGQGKGELEDVLVAAVGTVTCEMQGPAGKKDLQTGGCSQVRTWGGGELFVKCRKKATWRSRQEVAHSARRERGDRSWGKHTMQVGKDKRAEWKMSLWLTLLECVCQCVSNLFMEETCIF